LAVGFLTSAESGLRRKADELAEGYLRSPGNVGLVVGLLVGDECHCLGYGKVAEDSARPPDAGTVFEIGSITKVFTALLLADQVVERAVVLTEPLQALLPEVRIPMRGRPLTLLDLATHSSGLPRLPPGLVRQAWRHQDDPYARFTEDDLRAALEGVRLRREPGGRWSYSNFGAAVLGHALARRAGTTYARLLAERVTGPLGLVDTVVEVRPATGRCRRCPAWARCTRRSPT
jgi:D-alanyl-D-alanine-carboxypeptidase/D-alanyl-D-alanine-endopeptidase